MPRGERHHAARLDVDKVAEMRRLHYEENVTIYRISKDYGVAYPTAWDAIRYETWRHVDERRSK